MNGPEYIKSPIDFMFSDKFSMIKRYIDSHENKMAYDGIQDMIADTIRPIAQSEPWKITQILPVYSEIKDNLKKLKNEQNSDLNDIVNIDTYKSNIKNAIDGLEYVLTRPSYY